MSGEVWVLRDANGTVVGSCAAYLNDTEIVDCLAAQDDWFPDGQLHESQLCRHVVHGEALPHGYTLTRVPLAPVAVPVELTGTRARELHELCDSYMAWGSEPDARDLPAFNAKLRAILHAALSPAATPGGG